MLDNIGYEQWYWNVITYSVLLSAAARVLPVIVDSPVDMEDFQQRHTLYLHIEGILQRTRYTPEVYGITTSTRLLEAAAWNVNSNLAISGVDLTVILQAIRDEPQAMLLVPTA